MDTESAPIPIRCDSTLSVIKIQPATRNKKGNFPLVSQKFSDPEIEELYQLHSTNQKRTELFRCFLYAVLFYCVAQIIVHSFWIIYYNQLKPIDGYENSVFYVHDHESATPVRSHLDNRQDLHSLFNHPGRERTLTRDKNHHKPFKYSAVAGEIHHPIFIHHDIPPVDNDSIALEDKSHSHNAHPSHPMSKHDHLKHSVHLSTMQENDSPYKNLERRYRSSHRRHISSDYLYRFHGQSKIKARRRKRSPKMAKLSTVLDGHDSLMENTIGNNKGDMCYVVTVMTCLAITSVVVLFMLLPVHGCKRNPHIPVILWSITIFLMIALRTDNSIPLRTCLGWIVLETFLIWVTLPLRLQSVIFYTVPLAVIHTIIVFIKAKNQNFIGLQLVANLIILATTNVLGLLSFYLSDKKQRRAFMDTRQSLEMKLVIEEQAKEQERLLLSVLPEHLALKMRQDLGNAVDGQFKKIYMSRHENVSILYADIVGFTAISSTYSASELVKILNELFARFDRLAEKYHQLRIKILGDCYYCICGAPEERSDHAVLCVHMGLSMVKAIKDRFKVQVGIDMRVGIHTGAILAGVMGQRQWQFDVYSKDVELANKMESSGMAGRVHVSEKTLSFLNDDFEVEPGHGEKREEILRISGIKTYFIVRVIKPFCENTTGYTGNGELQADDIVTKDMPSDLNSTFAEDSNSAADECHTPRKSSEQENYSQRLKEELLSRDGYKDLSRQTQWLTLSFQDKVKETEFTIHKEPYAGISSLACPCALLAVAIATFFVISFGALILITAIAGLFLLLLLSCLSSWNNSTNKADTKSFSVTLNFLNSICSPESKSKLWARRLVTIATILILTAANFVFMEPCINAGRLCVNATIPEVEDHEVQPPLVLPKTSSRPFSSLGCLYPAYAFIFCSFFLMSVTLLANPLSWLKSISILFVLVAHILFITMSPFKQAVQCSETLSFRGGTDLIPEVWYLTVFATVVFLVLFTLNRRLEKSSRVLFLWKTEVEQQRERATLLRQKNEALVYNILPQHVASHFLGSRRRKHEELYSQSYSEVGILFASMPNFSDFYSEETVNNQGLECLRFLNEVISDFDALLELPKFSDNIIKIKTIGSTYMAASGLNPSMQANSNDPIKQRWSHLSLLVEFAFELKRALTSINEQSFNHFVLKMGINNGPATGGVIGARKPHYDIWGNSVNVASRMESTGKAGCIQVTEETYRILRIYGYNFEQRGLVNVKGKGQLMTYYLVGRGPELSDEQIQKFLSEASSEATNHIPPTSNANSAPK